MGNQSAKIFTFYKVIRFEDNVKLGSLLYLNFRALHFVVYSNLFG